MAFLGNLFGADESKKAHEHVFGGANGEEPRHQSSWTHEIVAGAAGFAGKRIIDSISFK